MWFSVEALYSCRIESDFDDGESLIERKIFLIDVPKGESSEDKARLMAKSMEHEYMNPDNEKVKWELRRILDIQELCEKTLYDGVEVFARLLYETQEEQEETTD